MLAILSLIGLKPIDYIIHENKIEFELIKYFVQPIDMHSHLAALSSEISEPIFEGSN